MLSFNGQVLPITNILPIPGLVDFVKQFGPIWYGYPTREFFTDRFNNKIFEIISGLVAADDIELNQSYKIPHIQYSLAMAETALTIDQWRWPAVTFGHDDWSAGNTRLTATGLTKIDPWNHLAVLAVNHSDIEYLSNPVEITTDQQFNELLIISWDRSHSEPVIFLEFEKEYPTRINLILRESNSLEKETTHFADYLAWFRKYGKGTPIAVYTQYPELVIDSFEFWEPYFLTDTNIIPGVAHVLHIDKPFQFDLSQLLFWIDLKHSKFIDVHQRFTLSLNSNSTAIKTISIADANSWIR